MKISYQVHRLAQYYDQEEQGKTSGSLDRLAGGEMGGMLIIICFRSDWN